MGRRAPVGGPLGAVRLKTAAVALENQESAPIKW